MKQLFLFRHAKTEERSLTGTDFARNLMERGKDDAKKVSHYLQKQGNLPELVLYSSANRTTQTFDIFYGTTTFGGEVIKLEELYHASASTILDTIEKYSRDYKNMMVIGHNMGISQLANMLCKDGCEELPTAGIAIIEFKENIQSAKGTLKAFITPKTI